MKIVLLFEPDRSLGFDREDEAETPRRLYVELDSDKDDYLLVYRRLNEAYDDGVRNIVLTAGIWEHITWEQLNAVLDHLSDMPEQPETNT